MLGGTITANLEADSVVPAKGHRRQPASVQQQELAVVGMFRKKLSLKQKTDFSNIRTDEIKMTEVNLHSEYWRKILSDSKLSKPQHVQLRLFT